MVSVHVSISRTNIVNFFGCILKIIHCISFFIHLISFKNLAKIITVNPNYRKSYNGTYNIERKLNLHLIHKKADLEVCLQLKIAEQTPLCK